MRATLDLCDSRRNLKLVAQPKRRAHSVGGRMMKARDKNRLFVIACDDQLLDREISLEIQMSIYKALNCRCRVFTTRSGNRLRCSRVLYPFIPQQPGSGCRKLLSRAQRAASESIYVELIVEVKYDGEVYRRLRSVHHAQDVIERCESC